MLEPVFLCGYMRSGTTLLYRFLATFDEFGVGLPDHNETDRAFETAVWFYSDPTSDLEAVYDQDWPHWKDAIPDRNSFKQFIGRYNNLSFLRKWLEVRLNKHVFTRAGVSRNARVLASRLSWRRHIVRNFLTLYSESYGAKKPLEKCPDNYLALHELSAILPDAKFIFIYRNPLDVYASLIRRGRLELELEPVLPIGRVAWMFITPEEFSKGWIEAVDCAREFARVSPDRLLMTKYENFTEARESECRRICDFLGLDSSRVKFSNRVDYDESKRFPLRSSTPVPNSNTFRKMLHPSDIEKIIRLCSGPMHELGYEALEDAECGLQAPRFDRQFQQPRL